MSDCSTEAWMAKARMGTLLPCPFCGSPATYVWDDVNDVWTAGCTNSECIACVNSTMQYGWPFQNEAIEEARDAWNARHERTCAIVSSRCSDEFHDGFTTWSYEFSCGHDVVQHDSEPPRYCEECGARVVSG